MSERAVCGGAKREGTKEGKRAVGHVAEKNICGAPEEYLHRQKNICGDLSTRGASATDFIGWRDTSPVLTSTATRARSRHIRPNPPIRRLRWPPVAGRSFMGPSHHNHPCQSLSRSIRRNLQRQLRQPFLLLCANIVLPLPLTPILPTRTPVTIPTTPRHKLPSGQRT